MLKIWGRANSNNVKKVLWCAEEAGVPYERLDAGGVFGVINGVEYGRLNPNRRSPVLEDNGLVLWESNAIVRYLSARYAEGALYSRDPRERALADRWMDWTTTTFVPPFTVIFLNLVRTAPADQDAEGVRTAVSQVGELLEIVDRALGEQPFLSGDRLGMGDIPLGCFLYAWFTMPISRPKLGMVDAWYERLMERPAFRKTVAIALS